MTKALTVADILALPAAQFTPVPVHMPEWGGTVWLREPDAGDGLEMDEEMKSLPPKQVGQATFILMRYCMCDEAGTRIFESTEQARKALGRRSMEELGRLVTAAKKLVEESKTEKNALSEAEPSASPTA